MYKYYIILYIYYIKCVSGHGGVRITVGAVFRLESEQSRDDPWKIKATDLLLVHYIIVYTLFAYTFVHNIITSVVDVEYHLSPYIAAALDIWAL